MQKTWSWLIITALTFTGLSYYNFKKANIQFANNTPSKLEIKINQLPVDIRVGQPVNISWSINAPRDFQTTNTTLYYSQISSPSAITKSDSPKAVGYQFSTLDYQSGDFNLPDKFDANVTFPRAGIFYLRAYAFVRGNHLWTEEKQIIVNK